MGAADNFTAEDIASLPTVSRSIYDIAKLSPTALAAKSGGMSFGGAEDEETARKAYDDMVKSGLAKQIYVTSIYNNRRE